MAISQETTTLEATRPELRMFRGRRSDRFPVADMPRRMTATVAGAVGMVVGAWGGIVPYVGHALHYSADGSATWTWNLQHGLLGLLPGAVAVVAGVLLVAAGWVRREQSSAIDGALFAGASALLGLSSVWFLIGAWVWPIYFSSHVLVAASPVRTFANVLGYFAAEGFVLAAISGVAGSWAVRSLSLRSIQSTR
jgi:hypothetical protein